MAVAGGCVGLEQHAVPADMGACGILHGHQPAAGRIRDAKLSGTQAMSPLPRPLPLRRTRLLLLVLAFAITPAFAVTVPDLYEVSVPLAGGRDAAFVEAMKAVVVRVSGRRDAPVRLGGALNDPRRFVQRFGETADNQLQVGFDSVSIDKLLIDAGLPVWGRERPATLVLLNVQASDGSTYWIDGNASTAEREIVSRVARERGLPIIWPDGTRIDPGSDASGDVSALMQAAARYNANAALLGNARSDGAGGLSVRWTLASDDGAASVAGSLEEGVNLAADTFARVYSASGTSLDSVTVEISGISDLGAYANTLNRLESMTLVRSVAVDQIVGDTLLFRLAVRGDAETLRRALALDAKLVPVAGDPAVVPERLQFRYQQ